MTNWWESAPLAEKSADDWWKAAPVAEAVAARRAIPNAPLGTVEVGPFTEVSREALPPEPGMMDRLGEIGGRLADSFTQGAVGGLLQGPLQAGGEFIDQTIQQANPLRQLAEAGVITGRDGAPLAPELQAALTDPLGAAAVAEQAAAVGELLAQDRAATLEATGGRPESIMGALGDPLQAIDYYGNVAAQSAAPVLAATLARNPRLAAAAIGVPTGGQQFSEARREGQDFIPALGEGVAAGGLETALGVLPFELAGTAGRRLLSIPAEGVAEGLTEIAQANVADQMRDRETPVPEQLAQALDAAIVGSGLQAAPVLAGEARAIADRRRSTAIPQQQSALGDPEPSIEPDPGTVAPEDDADIDAMLVKNLLGADVAEALGIEPEAEVADVATRIREIFGDGTTPAPVLDAGRLPPTLDTARLESMLGDTESAPAAPPANAATEVRTSQPAQILSTRDKPLPNAQMQDAPVGAWVRGPAVPGVDDNLFEIREVPLDRLVLPEVAPDGSIPSAGRDTDVRQYAERMRAGDRFPNARGYEMEDGRVKIADGHRRAMAARAAGRATIPVAVSPTPASRTPEQSGQASAPQSAPAGAGADLPTGTLYRRGSGRSKTSAEALQAPDGTWYTRNRSSGRWSDWQKRDSFDPSPTFGYRRASAPGANIRIPGVGTIPMGERDAPQPRKENPLLDLIVGSGGISRADAARMGVDPAEMNDRVGVRPIFGRNGVPLDSLREVMIEEGYLPPEDPDAPPRLDIDDVWDLVSRAIAGDPVFPIGDPRADELRRQEQEAQYDPEADRDDALAQWFDDASPDEPIMAGDEAEALSIAELAERAAATGVPDFDIAQASNESDAAYAARLWDEIYLQEANGGPDRQAEEGGIREGVRGREGRETAADREQADDFALGAPEPAAEAPRREVAPSQGAGLFGAPTARDFIDARTRERDDARNGRAGEGRTDMLAGDGELFAGARPAQARVDQPSSEGLESVERDLVVTHNLTAEKLMHAIRMGGLAVPSLAVTKGDASITGFGDITLIGDPHLADPKAGAKTFGADVYSPRYPEVQYKLDAAAVRRLNEIIGAKGASWQQYVTPDDLVSEDAFREHLVRTLGEDWRFHNAQEEAARVLREAGATEHTFEGYTYSGNRRYKPHTLENVVKKLKRDLRGGESFNYGVGSLRAKFTPQFRSLSAIRKEKGRLVSKEDFERVKQEVDAEFFALVEALKPYSQRGGSTFGLADDLIDAFGDAARMGVPRALEEWQIPGVPVDIQQDVARFLGKLRDLPTEYFEVIQARAVDVSEFRAAVIPSDTKPEVRAELERRGLEVIEYPRGDEAARRAAVKQAAEQSGLLFNEEPGATPAGSRTALESLQQGEADAEMLGLREAVNKVLGERGDDVIYLHGIAGLPERLRSGIERRLEQRGGRGRTAALYDQAEQQVYIFTDVVTTPDRAVWNALHEFAGHHGLRTLLGDKLDHALEIALQNPTVRRVADAIAAERNIDTTTQRGRMLAAEEALAELAAAVRTGDYDAIARRYSVDVPEGIRASVARAVENFVARLKRLLDDLFGERVFTDEDVRALLEAAWQAVDGDGATIGDMAESTAPDQTQTPEFRRWFDKDGLRDENGAPKVLYHVTTEGFDTFKPSRNGYFGPGIYLWDSIDKANAHAESMTRNAHRPLPADKGPAIVPVYARNASGPHRDPMMGPGQYVVSKASDVKSAIANRGTFDPESDSILEAVEAPPSDTAKRAANNIAKRQAEAKQRREDAADTLGVETGERGPWDFPKELWHTPQGVKGRFRTGGKQGVGLNRHVRAEYQDKMIAFRDVQRAIEKATGAELAAVQNVYQMENLMHGRVMEGFKQYEEARLEPLAKAMHKAGLDMSTGGKLATLAGGPDLTELEAYLWARHAKERNAAIAKKNPKMPDGGSGMSNATADKVLAAADTATLEPLAKMVDRITRETRKRLLDHGIITQAQHDAMAAQYEGFVPLRGQTLEADQEFTNAGVGAGGIGLDGRGKVVREAMGRGAGNPPVSILGEVIRDAQASIIQAEKARVGRSLMRLVLANPNPMWSVEPVNTERAVDANGEVYERAANDAADPSVVYVRLRGDLYKVQLNAPLAKAFAHVGVDQMTQLTRVAGKVNRYFSAIYTKYNPYFIARNGVRDMIFGMTGLIAEHGELTALKAALAYPAAARAAYRYARGKPPKGELGRRYKEYIEDGGKTGWVSSRSAEDLARGLGGGMTGYDPQGIKKAARVVGDFIGDANDAVESALRFAAYTTLRDKGVPRQKSAFYSKEMTVNFNRKGFSGSSINAWLIFFNPAMQGSKRFIDLARNKKAMGYMMGLAGIQAVAMMAAMGDVDDEGEPIASLIPEYLWKRNLVIVVNPEEARRAIAAGEVEGDNLAGVITIPMPYGVNVLTYGAGRIVRGFMSEEARPEDSAAGVTSDILSAAVQGVVPVPIGEGVSGLIHPLLGIFADIHANKNYFGSAIHSKYADKSVPLAQQGRPDTLEIYKLAAKSLNRAGGGDEVTPATFSWLNVAPEDVEYVTNELLGGPLRFVSDMATMTGKAFDPNVDMDPRDIPVLNSFYTNVDREAAQQSLYYNRKDAIERAAARVNLAFKREGFEAAQSLLEATPELKGATIKRLNATSGPEDAVRAAGERGGLAAARAELRKHPELAGVDAKLRGGQVSLFGLSEAEDRGRGKGTPRLSSAGNLQFGVRSEDSVYALFKAAQKAVSERNSAVRAIYAEYPATAGSLLTGSGRKREAAIREADRERADAQERFNNAYVRQVVGAAE